MYAHDSYDIVSSQLSTSVEEESKPITISGKKGRKFKHKVQGSAGHDLSVHPRVDPSENSDVCPAALQGMIFNLKQV